MHNLRFNKMLENGFLQFIFAMNDHILMGDIKSDPNAKINWTLSTQEYYNFKGKFYIASAPIQVTRFPPPKISNGSGSSAVEEWEEERIRQWKGLDPETRATFTWPSRGEIPQSSSVAFSCRSLGTDASVVHDIALDNFCLLVYKVTHVEYFNYATFPPKRCVYTLDLKNSCWDTQTSNP
ncbi:hypothetical protein INT47_000557 [Mucor saturninus]|uniref:Uncharacterized protein n=1 Tax=Mucor saturninus TaxID=64648 RepID=A0A8H7RMV5_9FUNG|nr:hypothetical protein INT47_000557 [Mucor saturninus]